MGIAIEVPFPRLRLLRQLVFDPNVLYRLTQSGPGHLLQSEQRQAQQHHSLPSHGGGHQDYGYMNDARWD